MRPRYTYGYDTLSRVNAITHSEGATETRSYDARNRLTGVTVTAPGGPYVHSYGYDPASNLTSQTRSGITTTYAYDNINQLLSETRTGYSASYTYDANGNRLSRTVGGVTQAYVYDDADKLLNVSVGGSPIKSYTYDKSGRVQSVTTSAGTTSLAWDGRSRLTGITYPSSASNSFAYNAFGARMSITDSAGTRALRRSGASVLAPVVKEGSSDRYLPGVWESHSGSALNPWSGIKNAENQLKAGGTDSRTYDAFGNVLSQSANWSKSLSGYGGALGYQEDGDSGLKLLGHRYYDPDLGRFLSRDPIKDGRNWYVYCENNPLTRADASGLKSVGFPFLPVVGPGHPDMPVPPGASVADNVDYITAPRPALPVEIPVFVPLPEAGGSYPGGYLPGLGGELDREADWVDKVRSGGEWDYKRIDKRYENFGNYNYGATGAALGYRLPTLQVAASYVQIYSGTSDPAWGPPWPVGPPGAGDDPEDQKWIKRGYDDFHAGRLR